MFSLHLRYQLVLHLWFTHMNQNTPKCGVLKGIFYPQKIKFCHHLLLFQTFMYSLLLLKTKENILKIFCNQTFVLHYGIPIIKLLGS